MHAVPPVGTAQVGTVQVGTAQVGIAQVGTAQVGVAQVGTAQVGTAQIGTAQVGIAQVGTAQVGIAQIGSAQVGIAQVGTAQIGIAQVGTAQIGIAQAGTAQVGTAQIYLSICCYPFHDGQYRWRRRAHQLSDCSDAGSIRKFIILRACLSQRQTGDVSGKAEYAACRFTFGPPRGLLVSQPVDVTSFGSGNSLVDDLFCD